MADKLTHFDDEGRAQMVDIGAKPVTRRRAVAEGRVTMSPHALGYIAAQSHSADAPPPTGANDKGDVLATAQIAGIMAAKRTAELIPLCHILPLSKVRLKLHCDAAQSAVMVEAEVETQAQTGVEMEALTAVSVACLTVYDMVKSVDRGMTINGITLTQKSGGQSGDWLA